jgi:hypothetical protein
MRDAGKEGTQGKWPDVRPLWLEVRWDKFQLRSDYVSPPQSCSVPELGRGGVPNCSWCVLAVLAGCYRSSHLCVCVELGVTGQFFCAQTPFLIFPQLSHIQVRFDTQVTKKVSSQRTSAA